MLTLSCIGAGRLGQTLCHLLSQRSDISIGQIINSDQVSSQRAVDFIGCGTAATIDDLKQADIWLIATPDNQIESAVKQLHTSAILKPETVIFHCSGLLPSTVLNDKNQNLNVASVHPIHSFADPKRSINTFSGCHCAIEGSANAVTQLDALFSSLGAHTFTLDSQQKSLYHAASVMACNYLVSLLEVSHQMLKEAGIDVAGVDVAGVDEAGVDKAVINSTENFSPLESLIRQTLDNYFLLGATQALTGPIARGDTETVKTHIKVLQQAPDADLWKQLYSALGKATVSISAKQGLASKEQLTAIAAALDNMVSHEDR
jgi:predicted short-subunit dehydrogenase-like oxidoreductase (DUF2520 family)